MPPRRVRRDGPLERLRASLAEVEDIAGEEMRPYLTDLALERARLAPDVPSSVRNETESAAHQTAIAEKLIAETGYRRRDANSRNSRRALPPHKLPPAAGITCGKLLTGSKTG